MSVLSVPSDPSLATVTSQRANPWRHWHPPQTNLSYKGTWASGRTTCMAGSRGSLCWRMEPCPTTRTRMRVTLDVVVRLVYKRRKLRWVGMGKWYCEGQWRGGTDIRVDWWCGQYNHQLMWWEVRVVAGGLVGFCINFYLLSGRSWPWNDMERETRGDEIEPVWVLLCLWRRW